MQNQNYTPAGSTMMNHGQTTNQQMMTGDTMVDWSREVNVPMQRQTRSASDTGIGGMMETGMSGNQSGMSDSRLNMQHGLPNEVIESPTTVSEVYAGSVKAMLNRNLGNYVVATFLIGTQNTVSWEGVLYDVGNDYVTIYQPGRDRYIVNDIYSLKYMEFYDIQRHELCDRLIREQGLEHTTGNFLNTGR